MSKRMMAILCGFVGASALVAASAVSQEHDGHGHGEGGEEMAAWMKMSQPGEHHEHMKPLVGNWNLLVTWRMSPDAAWEETNSTASITWAMGERFLLEKVRGDMGGQPFEGMAIMGYDNARKKHTSMWIDNHTTSTAMAYGTCDSSGKTMTFVGESIDPMTGESYKEKTVLRIINDNKLLFQMYRPGPDGGEFMSMEITYTRK